MSKNKAKVNKELMLKMENELLELCASSLRRFGGVNDGVWLCAVLNVSRIHAVNHEDILKMIDKPQTD